MAEVSAPAYQVRNAVPASLPLHAVARLSDGLAETTQVRNGGHSPAGAHRADPRAMRVLVIAADPEESGLVALEAFLGAVGVPHTVMIASDTQLVPGMLWDGDATGRYQGVILTTGNLVHRNAQSQWESAFDAGEWEVLREYEAAFGVRQVTNYTLPLGQPDTYGLAYVGPADTTATPLTATLTDAGRSVFSYLNPQVSIPIQYAWTYLATVEDAAVTTPLVVTTEGQFPIVSVHASADGRENLTITSESGPHLIHSMLLSYGVIDWVTRGLFLGERHANLNVQVDDLFLGGVMWDVASRSPNSPNAQVFRLTAEDYQSLGAWQERPRPILPGLSLELAYNGWGATGVYEPDTLTSAVAANSGSFGWTSHTFDHRTLDTLSYSEALGELTRNEAVASEVLKLPEAGREAMVQPSVSGLTNPEFLRAAADFGIRYLVSDTSQVGWDSPSFNAGYQSDSDPRIFIVPRRPVNLFCNVSTPDEWVGQYNAIYGPSGSRPFWDHDLTVEEILDFESQKWLERLMKGELNPLMFHQSNLRAYDSTGRSLLGRLIDATLEKYAAYYTLPIRNLRQQKVGELMQRRMAYDTSGVRGIVVPAEPGSASRCSSITLVADAPATVPVTGVTYGSDAEVYGGKPVSYLALEANVPVSLPASACQ